MGQSRGRNVRRWITARPLVVSAVVVSVAAGLVTARVAAPGERAPGIATWILISLFLVVALTVVNLLVRLAGVDDDVARIATRLVDDPVQQRLLTRWLGRARWARFIGGFSGVLAWVLGTNARGDVLLLGTLGIGVGALAAEAHHVRRRHGPRTVSLEVRTLAQYLPRGDRLAMHAVAAVAAWTVVVGAVHGPSRSAVVWGACAVAVVGALRWAQLRVVRRPRPAVPANLVEADDLARRLAVVRGLGRPAVYVGLVLVSQAFDELAPLLGGFARALAVTAWIAALVLWVHNRRLGLDKVLRAPAGAVVGA